MPRMDMAIVDCVRRFGVEYPAQATAAVGPCPRRAICSKNEHLFNIRDLKKRHSDSSPSHSNPTAVRVIQ